MTLKEYMQIVKRRFPGASDISIKPTGNSGGDWLIVMWLNGSQYSTFINGMAESQIEECGAACDALQSQIDYRTAR